MEISYLAVIFNAVDSLGGAQSFILCTCVAIGLPVLCMVLADGWQGMLRAMKQDRKSRKVIRTRPDSAAAARDSMAAHYMADAERRAHNLR